MSTAPRTSPAPRAMASLAHHYDDPKDAVVAPHKFMALTHYYVDRWLPELGERGHIIVTVLRRMGYLDRERDVERGGIDVALLFKHGLECANPQIHLAQFAVVVIVVVVMVVCHECILVRQVAFW